MIRMINISVLFHFSIGFIGDSFLWFSSILICQVLPALVCWKLSSTDLQETATLFSDLIKIHLSFFWLNTKVRELIIIDPRSICSGPSLLSAFTHSNFQNLQCERTLHRRTKVFWRFCWIKKSVCSCFSHEKVPCLNIEASRTWEPTSSPFPLFSPKVVQCFLHTHTRVGRFQVCVSDFFHLLNLGVCYREKNGKFF